LRNGNAERLRQSAWAQIIGFIGILYAPLDA
jgi:hypothetical protein